MARRRPERATKKQQKRISAAAAKVRRPPPPASRKRLNAGRGALGSTLATLALVVLVLAPPTFVLVAAGMLPTIVAVITDRTPRKSAALCVGGLNLSGVAPYVVFLWQGPNGLNAALATLTDVYAWLMMYSAAALGWLLYLGLPSVLGAGFRMHADHRIRELEATQARLKDVWGEEIAEAAAKR